MRAVLTLITFKYLETADLLGQGLFVWLFLIIAQAKFILVLYAVYYDYKHDVQCEK